MKRPRSLRERISYRRNVLKWGGLPMGGSGPVQARLTASWRPFYSTAIFQPKFKLKIRNDARRTFDTIEVSWFIAPFDAPISQVQHIQVENWELINYGLHDRYVWKPNEVIKLRRKIPGRFIPKPGTYALKIDIRGGSKMKSVMPDVPDDDPFQGQFSIEAIAERYVHEYIRIEPFSSVLTFLIVIATLVTSIGTIIATIYAASLHP